MKTDRMLPFLKWVGGKRWLIPKITPLIPANIGRYIEPFLGGGAIFFYIAPNRAVLADLNEDLIEVYDIVKESWDELQSELERHHIAHSKTYYYKVRATIPGSAMLRAARFLYLNRTCWNGLYRVNLDGVFNVPIGTKTSVILDTDDFEKTALLLRRAQLMVSDFEKTIARARRNDLVFADPPYTVKHNFNNFRKYNERLFSWQDQIRLRDSLFRARDRGAHVILCNANNKEIQKLYCGFGVTIRVNRPSVLAADAAMRRTITELVISATH